MNRLSFITISCFHHRSYKKSNTGFELVIFGWLVCAINYHWESLEGGGGKNLVREPSILKWMAKSMVMSTKSCQRGPGAWMISRLQYPWRMSSNEKENYALQASFPPDATLEEIQEFYRKWSETYDKVSWVIINKNFIQCCCGDCSVRLHV